MTTATPTRRVLTGPRWSSAVNCPLTAVLQAQGAPEDPVSDQVAAWRKRGIAIGEAAQGSIVAELRAQGRRPVVEVEVPWPAADPVGVGHADVYIPHERLIVEVKSRADCELDETAAVQAAGYALNHPRAEHAVVLVIDPQSGMERSFPLHLPAFVERVRAIEDQVVAGIRDGVLPERACRYPGDGPGMFCPHVSTCFAGWERPRPEDLPGWEADLRRLADLEDQLAKVKDADHLVAERDRLRDALRAAMEPGNDYMAGGIRVRYVEVAGRESFSLAAARKAGHSLPEHLEAFVSTSGGHERWTVRRMEGT